jgi:ribosomal protein L11 methyltransferase
MIQVSITVDRARLDRVEQTLFDHGAQSVALRDAADQPVLEPLAGEMPLWPQVVVTGLFTDATETATLRRNLEEVLDGDSSFHSEPLPERDWARVWLDDFKPMRFGRRLRYERDVAAVDIRLDPGLAFGTGTHPTTALCLEWLDANPPLGADVIDYGCGSGILGIAAIKLGARTVRAVDIDSQALDATRSNARRNGISHRQIEICHPNALACDPANLLISNILAHPLIELAARHAGRVKSGGKMILSGLLQSQAGTVSMAYAPWFAFAQAREAGEWVLLEGTRL